MHVRDEHVLLLERVDRRVLGGHLVSGTRKVDVKLLGKGISNSHGDPWREAGPPNHHDDKVDSDQQVVNKELSLMLLERVDRRVLGRHLVSGLKRFKLFPLCSEAANQQPPTPPGV